MAETTVLQIDFGDTLARIVEINKATAQLTEENKKLKQSTTEEGAAIEATGKQMAFNEAQLKSLNKEKAALNKEVQNAIAQNNAEAGSIEANRLKLSQLTAEYVKLANPTAQQTALIKDLSDKLKEQESAIGNNTRNVGNYTESIREAIKGQSLFGVNIGNGLDKLTTFKNGLKGAADATKAATTGTKGVTGALGGLKTAFISLGLPLLIAAIGFLVKGLLSMEPVVKKIEQLFAGLSAAWDAVIGAFASFDFSNFFGKIGDAASKAAELTKAMQELEDATRRQSITNSEASKDIAKLIVQAQDRTKTERDRITLLEEANAIEKQNFEQNKSLAEENVRIAKERLELSKKNKGASDEEQQAYADAVIALNKLEEDSLTLTEKLNNRINKFKEDAETERRNTENDQKKAVEDAKKLAEERFNNEINAAKGKATELQRIEVEELNQARRTQEEFDNNTKQIQQDLLNEQIEIRKKYGKDVNELTLQQAEQERTNYEQSLAKQKEIIQQNLNDQLAASTRYFQEQKNIELENLNNGVINQEEYNNRIHELNIDAQTDKLDILTVNGQQTEQLELDIQTQLLENQRAYNEAKVANDEEAAQQQMEINQRLQDDFRKTQEAKLTVAEATASALGNILQGAAALGAKTAAFQKLLALYEVGVNTAKSIAAGIAGATTSATATGPGAFVATPIFIATTIATILGAMGQAITILKANPPKMAHGGEVDVGGKPHSEGGTKYYGQDGNAFEVERGEKIFVLNKNASDYMNKFPLLSSLNQKFGGKSWGDSPTRYAASGGQVFAPAMDGGFTAREAQVRVSESLIAEQIVEGFKKAPQPIVKVSEINRVQGSLTRVAEVSEL